MSFRFCGWETSGKILHACTTHGEVAECTVMLLEHSRQQCHGVIDVKITLACCYRMDSVNIPWTWKSVEAKVAEKALGFSEFDQGRLEVKLHGMAPADWVSLLLQCCCCCFC